MDCFRVGSMKELNETRLKYICSSFSSNISIDLLSDEATDESKHKVFGAAGLIGYYKFFYSNNDYLGIIKDGAGVGRISKYPKYSSVLGTMAYITPNKHIDIDWLKYCILSMNLNESIDKTTIPHIYFSEYGNRKIVIFNYEEQKRIASYLDEQCEKIDEIMVDIQNQINTLEDYRKSVISETVTRGLNPNVEMKETDMGWIKQVPAKWNISRIASVYELRNEKVSDKDYQPLSVTMKGVLPQLDTVAKSDAHDDRKLVRKGDFAINSRSDRRGSCGIAPCDGSISLINTVLCPLTNMNPIYYNWLFHTTEFADEFYKWGHGIVDDLWTTGWQEMKNILIPVPPVQEQEEIAKYLNKKCADIDSIIEDKKAQFETIENYKKSLIYEYVTGKKEVPENE